MGDVTGEAGARDADLEAINSIKNEVEGIEKLLQQQNNDLERHMKLLDGLQDHLWIGRDEAQAAKQHLYPLAKEASVAVHKALLDATSLRLAISPDIIANDLRSSVIEMLTDVDDGISFTDEELQMSLKEAKRQYTGDLLRKWKAARKELV